MSLFLLALGILLLAVGLAGLVAFLVVFLGGLDGLDSSEEL